MVNTFCFEMVKAPAGSKFHGLYRIEKVFLPCERREVFRDWDLKPILESLGLCKYSREAI